MILRYENDSWQRFCWRPLDHDPFWVEWLANDLSANKGKGPSRLMIAGIFDPCGLTRIKQRRSADEYRLLHCVYDYDLVWMTARRSKITQVCRNCPAQVCVATV